jgi:hypothetical protein
MEKTKQLERYSMYASWSVVVEMKSKTIRWAYHVARVEKTDCTRHVDRKPWRGFTSGKSRRRLQDNTVRFIVLIIQLLFHACRQELPATVARTLVAPVALSRSTWSLRVCRYVSVYCSAACTVLYLPYVKCGSARKYNREVSVKTVPSTTDIVEIYKKVRSTGSLLDMTPSRIRRLLT